jgi:hypothetical protein
MRAQHPLGCDPDGVATTDRVFGSGTAKGRIADIVH